MKKQLLSLSVLFASYVGFGQTAKLQVIHNAAAPIADTVDVYVGSTRLLNDFVFRTATPFVEVPGNTDLRIGIALANSTSVADTIAGLGTTVNLPAGGTYVAIANGVVPVNSFEANPTGKSIAFALYPYLTALEASPNATSVSFAIFHGATDAPAVDVIANGAVTLADSLVYGEFNAATYTTVPAAAYTVAIHPEGASDPLVKYNVDLSTLGGGAAVVLASGFLSPANEPAGAKPFALIGVLASGAVVEFPTVPLSTGLFDKSFQSASNLVYPNPVRDVLNVKNAEVSSLQVMDMKGQVMKDYTSNVPSQISVEDLQSGIYVLKMTKGNTLYTTKLSVE